MPFKRGDESNMINNERDYPDYAFRGLTESGSIDLKFKRVLAEAFNFNGNHKNDNGYDELSINWDDDFNSLEYLKVQRKENADVLKYKIGIVRLPTNKLKEMKNKYKGYFLYERKPIENNSYHGNLLLDIDRISKRMKRLISSELALNVDMVCTYNEEKSEWEYIA